MWELLVRVWWPHVMHGPIVLGTSKCGEMVAFDCACGDRLVLPVEVAEECGVLRGASGRALVERTTS